MRERLRKLVRSIKRLKGRKYAKFVLIITLLCAFLIVSIVFALCMDSSITRSLSNCCPIIQKFFSALRRIINIEAVLKMGEAVGICSFLIAWIYAALDKQELGFRYSELLWELYPGYYWFVFLHLLAFIVCMWMGKAGKLEAATFALILLLSGSALQWHTLKNLILFTPNRVKIALDRWKRLVFESNTEHNKNLLHYIYMMANALTLETDDCYKEMFPVFTNAVVQYINGLSLTTPDEWGQAIYDVSKIWASLLRERNSTERELLVTGVVDSCINQLGLQILSAGYFLWLYDQSIKNGMVNETALLAVSKDVATLTHAQQTNHQNFLFYNEAAFTLFVWMHFLCGTIGMNRELFKLTPSKTITDEDKPLLRGVAQIVFTQESCREYLELVLHELS